MGWLSNSPVAAAPCAFHEPQESSVGASGFGRFQPRGTNVLLVGLAGSTRSGSRTPAGRRERIFGSRRIHARRLGKIRARSGFSFALRKRMSSVARNARTDFM